MRASGSSGVGFNGILQADLAALVTTFQKSCSLPIDKIYGLLAILRHPAFELIPVSPTSTYQDVFTAAASAVLTVKNSAERFALFHYVDTTTRLPDVPSWVPNFNSTQRTVPLSPLSADGEYIYSTSSYLHDPAKIGVQLLEKGQKCKFSELKIRIHGRFVDEIIAHIPGDDSGWAHSWQPTSDGVKQNQWERKCWDLTRARSRGKFVTRAVGPTNQIVKEYIDNPIRDYPQSYYTTLVAGSTITGKTCKRSSPTEQTYKEFRWRLSQIADPAFEDFHTRLHENENPGVRVNWDLMVSKDGADYTQPYYLAEEKEEYHTRMFDVCRGRSFFITKGGRLGLGGMVKNGDHVAVLHGARTSFIIRAKATPFQGSNLEDSSYSLVSESYVYGLMDKEIYESSFPELAVLKASKRGRSIIWQHYRQLNSSTTRRLGCCPGSYNSFTRKWGIWNFVDQDSKMLRMGNRDVWINLV